MKHKNILIKIAIADAYGMGFEFVPQDIVDNENNLSCYRVHGLYSELDPGQYTDDTQMTIALFEYLHNTFAKEEFAYGYDKKDFLNIVCDKEKIADSFLHVFQRDPRKGYAKGFQTVLEAAKSGKDIVEMIERFGKTESNGACMRAIPAGFLTNMDEVLAFTQAQASITHRDRGVLAAKAIALAAFFIKQFCVKSTDLPRAINNILGEDIDWSWDGSRVASKADLGMMTARAALHSLMTTESYAECLKKSISYGGDTDSVAAIACGLVALSDRHIQDIPEPLINNLERGPYGLGFLFNKV